MFYDALENSHGLPHDPFQALVVPRPIGWISTLNPNGGVNLAPYSFFNAVGMNPYYVMFASGGRKDSQTNAEASGEFVCSIASYDLREKMLETGKHVAPDVDEMEMAGLEKAPSTIVKPPRVAASPAAFECRHYHTVTLPSNDVEEIYSIVIGVVVGVYIADSVLQDGLVDMERLKPISRLGYQDYATLGQIFSI